jgi:hypothetical protein
MVPDDHSRMTLTHVECPLSRTSRLYSSLVPPRIRVFRDDQRKAHDRSARQPIQSARVAERHVDGLGKRMSAKRTITRLPLLQGGATVGLRSDLEAAKSLCCKTGRENSEDANLARSWRLGCAGYERLRDYAGCLQRGIFALA